jgi:hypothetical protein
MFLIESGKVKRVKGGIPVDELGQDDVSGMLHLFTQDPCFATLVVRLPAIAHATHDTHTHTHDTHSGAHNQHTQCEEDTVVWTLGAKEFHDLLGVSDSTLAAKLLVVFSKQLRENSKLIRKKQAHTKFTITFFDFKPYEKGPFEQANKDGSEVTRTPHTRHTHDTHTRHTHTHTRHTHTQRLRWRCVQGKYEFNFCPERLSERTVREAAGSDAVCIFVNDRADAKVVEELADMKVKLIALRCAGYNNVDLKACQGTQPSLSTSSHARTHANSFRFLARSCVCVCCGVCVCVFCVCVCLVHGIQVVRVPAYSPYAVAEHAMGLILTLNRKLHKYALLIYLFSIYYVLLLSSIYVFTNN